MEYAGTLRSPPDNRDYIYRVSKKNKRMLLPAVLDYRSSLPGIRDQRNQGTCAAQAGACIKEYQERINIDYKSHFSPQFIYNHRKNYPGAGMSGRDVMNILENIGVCREVGFPYGDIRTGTDIPPEAVTEAANNKIKYYALVDFNVEYGDKNIDTLKTCLVENGPCWISFPCYHFGPDFWNNKNNTETDLGHAVTVVGYNNVGFILRNSWGTQFAHDGYCDYTYSEFLQGKHWEIWTCVDDLNSLKLPDTKERCMDGSCKLL